MTQSQSIRPYRVTASVVPSGEIIARRFFDDPSEMDAYADRVLRDLGSAVLPVPIIRVLREEIGPEGWQTSRSDFAVRGSQ